MQVKKLYFHGKPFGLRFNECYKLLQYRIDSSDLGEMKEIDLELRFSVVENTKMVAEVLWIYEFFNNTNCPCGYSFGIVNDDGFDVQFSGEYQFLTEI